MSRLNDLINELCPDGVDYKRLGEITLYTRGKGLSKDDKNTGDEKIILYGELYTTYDLYIDDIVSRASSESVINSVLVEKGDLLLPISSTTKEAQIGRASVLRCSNAYLGGDAISLRPFDCIDSSFLMYLINGCSFEKKKMKCVKGTTIRHLDTKSLLNISIPVPPLDVQREIVRILDSFTLLSTKLKEELVAELTARKQQYDCYREKLFAFEDNTDHFEIGEVCKLTAGGDVPKGAFSETQCDDYPIPIISNGIGEKGLYGYTDSYKIFEPSVTVAARGAGVGHVTYRDYPYYPIIRLVSVIPDERIVAKYLYYAMQRVEFKPTQGGIPQLTVPMISKYKIPIPAIEEQIKIVSILERFEVLCEEFSAKLSAEIDACQKQYEYYRDMVLSFKKRGEAL